MTAFEVLQLCFLKLQQAATNLLRVVCFGSWSYACLIFKDAGFTFAAFYYFIAAAFMLKIEPTFGGSGFVV
jgi:hypothetical protein